MTLYYLNFTDSKYYTTSLYTHVKPRIFHTTNYQRKSIERVNSSGNGISDRGGDGRGGHGKNPIKSDASGPPEQSIFYINDDTELYCEFVANVIVAISMYFIIVVIRNKFHYCIKNQIF